jgi:hypothetical protein
MNFVRTVGSVPIVITQFQSANSNGTDVLQADTSDKQQTLSDNFKVRHPVVFSYNWSLIINHQHNFILVIFTETSFDRKG